MKKLLPILLLFVGAGAGVGAGLFLRPEPEPVEQVEEAVQEKPKEGEEKAEKKDAEPSEEEAGVPTSEYAKMSNQFVIPVIEDGQIVAHVVLSLSIEVEIGEKSTVYLHEPKLRDNFLQVLFNHANLGGFDGEFTSITNMDVLRKMLLEGAKRNLGDLAKDVLILDLARQDY